MQLSFKASREQKSFLGTDEVKASSTSLEVQFWKSCKNAKENSRCFTSIKYLVAYIANLHLWIHLIFPRLPINTKLFVFKGFVRDDNDEKQSFALRKKFSFFLLVLLLDLLWPNMEKVKVWWYYWYTTMVVKTGKTAFVFLSVILEMRNLPFF